ncbi:2-amino-4-hydroxy-6-hydroxymethyldihydropteridine diphosphokinase [[Limnothrix rosea] IAM M-220]|uniref:2-amino-4-hydroxy-6- hydroxymethyldihydropteridine diphosphokinase n=1 Tax=[Limnothrix rosea] IAM M-220 TaxID=454133 RepID=UPI00095FA6E5|nr:2-amino-4-hydroxy-6-hydroxymethyldihydropteridine diphosphokinase [[Limnothrix rosea] IAM M-220]OKH12342.1 2-amino-4-hydroxy-6-hydroxymethyldihydropteridine diphosphokinase [[Limnothrix rosea] IAM M-220]
MKRPGNSSKPPVNVAIALGSNLGDSLQTLEAAITEIEQTPEITLIAKSAWYRTKPIGPPQPDYINGCITCETELEPEALLAKLHQIEYQFGRERKEHWGARTLDLDLILYGDRRINTPTLTVPHARMQERAFVLVPLAEIAADWVDPRNNLTVKELGDRLPQSDLKDIKPLKI